MGQLEACSHSGLLVRATLNMRSLQWALEEGQHCRLASLHMLPPKWSSTGPQATRGYHLQCNLMHSTSAICCSYVTGNGRPRTLRGNRTHTQCATLQGVAAAQHGLGMSHWQLARMHTLSTWSVLFCIVPLQIHVPVLHFIIVPLISAVAGGYRLLGASCRHGNQGLSASATTAALGCRQTISGTCRCRRPQ